MYRDTYQSCLLLSESEHRDFSGGKEESNAWPGRVDAQNPEKGKWKRASAIVDVSIRDRGEKKEGEKKR